MEAGLHCSSPTLCGDSPSVATGANACSCVRVPRNSELPRWGPFFGCLIHVCCAQGRMLPTLGFLPRNKYRGFAFLFLLSTCLRYQRGQLPERVTLGEHSYLLVRDKHPQNLAQGHSLAPTSLTHQSVQHQVLTVILKAYSDEISQSLLNCMTQ